MIERLMAKYKNNPNVEWNRDTDNFDVLNRSDILVSDFSGVVFDYTLIFDKPIIYTNPEIDVSIYDAWWLDQPLWTQTALPRLGKQITDENIDHMDELINEVLTSAVYKEGREEVRNETWRHITEGATRVADYLINKYEELQNVKGVE